MNHHAQWQHLSALLNIMKPRSHIQAFCCIKDLKGAAAETELKQTDVFALSRDLWGNLLKLADTSKRCAQAPGNHQTVKDEEQP